jgi:hypothetical protein
MAQAVSRQPFTVEVLVSPCGICGGQSLTPNSSVFSCQYHSTMAVDADLTWG